MVAKQKGYFPPPGAQQPQKYPRVGPNYLQYGEQPGWTYSPRDDKYYRDQQSREELQRYEEETGLRTKPPKQPGLGETVLPIVAATGAVEVGRQIGSRLPDTLESIGKTPAPPTNITGQTVTPTPPPAQTPSGLLSANTPAPLPKPVVTNVQSVTPMQSTALPDGSAGTVMSDGSVVSNSLPPGTEVTDSGEIISAKTGQVVGRTVQGAMGAYQIYQGIKGWKDDKVGAGLDIASGSANVAAAAGSATAATVAGPLMAAKGAYEVGKGLDSGGEGLRSGTTQLGAGIGSMVLPGLGTAVGAAAGNAIGYGLQDDGWKNDAALLLTTGGMAAPLVIARKFGFNPIRQTVRQRAQSNTQDLLKQAKGDPVAEAYVQGMRQQYNTGAPDPSKPFAGKYASWEEYQKAGLEAPDLTGVYGNLKTYGNDWAKLTQEQRVAVTQLNINDGIYKSKKGEVEITDQEKAKKNLQAVMGGAVPTPAKPIMGGAAGPAPLPPGTTPQQVAATPSQGLQSINPGITPPNQTGLLAAVPAGVSSQVQNLRTNTRSPGIDKQGRRIRY